MELLTLRGATAVAAPLPLDDGETSVVVTKIFKRKRKLKLKVWWMTERMDRRTVLEQLLGKEDYDLLFDIVHEYYKYMRAFAISKKPAIRAYLQNVKELIDKWF